MVQIENFDPFKIEMAAVGAQGQETSDDPHIPSVTIVHRYWDHQLPLLHIAHLCGHNKINGLFSK